MNKLAPSPPSPSLSRRLFSQLKICALLAVLAGSLSPQLSHAEAAHPADIRFGDRSGFRPLFRFQPEFSLFEVNFTSRGHVGTVEEFQIDSDANTYAPGFFVRGFTRGRIYVDSKVRYSNFRFMMDLEFEFADPGSTRDTSHKGKALPYSGKAEQEIRKALATVAIARSLFLAGGITQSHWGLGLMANHGDRRWAPGSAAFVDPIKGDKVMRAMIATPKYRAQKLQFFLAYDKVLRDEELHEQEHAGILSSAMRFGRKKSLSGGILWRFRDQESLDAKVLTRKTLNLHISHRYTSPLGYLLSNELEAFSRWGESARRSEIDDQKTEIQAHAIALETRLDLGGYGFNIDTIYSSGDTDPAASRETKASLDPNYEVGLILFPLLRHAQSKLRDSSQVESGSGGIAPDPVQGLESRTGLESAFVLFPRIWWRASDGLELYSGVLLAWDTSQASEQNSMNNLQARGGDFSERKEGSFLGTEYDFGLRYTVLMNGSELMIGLEGGLFHPGPRMRSTQGENSESTGLIRTLWSLRI